MDYYVIQMKKIRYNLVVMTVVMVLGMIPGPLTEHLTHTAPREAALCSWARLCRSDPTAGAFSMQTGFWFVCFVLRVCFESSMLSQPAWKDHRTGHIQAAALLVEPHWPLGPLTYQV